MATHTYRCHRGISAKQKKAMLDATQAVKVSVFGAPLRDRYQVLHSHPEGNVVVQESGLKIARGREVVLISLVSRPRTPEQKQRFHQALSGLFAEWCALGAADLVIFTVSNTDVDWGFGYAKAQFVIDKLT